MAIHVSGDPAHGYRVTGDTTQLWGNNAAELIGRVIIIEQQLPVAFGPEEGEDRSPINEDHVDAAQHNLLERLRTAQRQLSTTGPETIGQALVMLDQAEIEWNLTYPDHIPAITQT